jgi:hypothetical protein
MLLTLSLLTATSLAAPLGPGVKVRRVSPPPTVLAGVSSVQVSTFKGYGGEGVASKLRQALQDENRSSGRKADGSVVGDIVQLGGDVAGAAVGGGVAGSLVSGLVGGVGQSAGQAVGGKVQTVDNGLKPDVFEVVTSGADAAVSGSIAVSDKVETYQAKQAKRDKNGKIVKNSKGKTVYVTVDCKKRIVNTTVAWKVVGADSSVLGEKSFERRATDSKCGADRGKLASKDDLAKRTLSGLGKRIANEFAPAWTVTRLDYKRDKAVKESMKLARKGLVEQALCSVREVEKAEPYSVEAKLALGVYHESLGYVEQAAELYAKAAAINNDKNALKRQEQAEYRLTELETLANAYGTASTIEPTDYSFCPEIPDGRPVVVKRPTDLWSDREDGSPSKVAELPKGLKLYVTEETPSQVKVTTADGNEGWVNVKHVK